jgi:uncharacterized membrane protein
MNAITVEIPIAAPPDRVWSIMRDVDQWPSWTPSVTSVARLDSAPLAAGSRVRIRQPKFPPAVWKVETLSDADRSFTWVSSAPGLRVTGRHSVEPDGSGSIAKLGIEFDGFFGPLWARATRTLTEQYVNMEAQGLKARSEAGLG